MNITIIGGGNIGTILAAELALKEHNVNVYTSSFELWTKKICIYNEQDELLRCGTIKNASFSLEECVINAEMILITYPPHLLSDIVAKLYPLVKKRQYIGIIPGSGGIEKIFSPLIAKGCFIWGLQRVHTIARIKEVGISVYELGRKEKLFMASLAESKADFLNAWCTKNFNIPCELLPNYLNLSLVPSNAILHTSRLFSLLVGSTTESIIQKEIFFYREWNDTASELLISCDIELENICNSIPVDLTGVESLRKYYNSYTPTEMTLKIRSITAFKNIKVPMNQTTRGWKIDVQSRYFKSDFPYGLKVIIDCGKEYGIPIPVMEQIWNWYLNFIEGE